MEPMQILFVKAVAIEGSLTIVQVEYLEQPLLFEDEIPPGCVQYIAAELSANGEKSEEVCNKMCKILCSLDMNDRTSRIFLTIQHKCKLVSYTHDSRQ